MRKLTSLTNPLVKDLVRLGRSSSQRRQRGVFLIESERELRRALQAGFNVEQVLLTPRLLGETELLSVIHQTACEVLEITDDIARKIAYRENPSGLIAVVESRVHSLQSLPPGNGPIVIVSGVEKPGNVGAILRSCDAAGVAGLFIDAPEADVFNPNCIRASTGAVFTVPIVADTPSALLNWLRNEQYRVLAATPEAGMSVYSEDLSGHCALVLGAEAEGLNAFWKANADANIVVPMQGRVVDSLNVSVTAAVLMFEALRQRHHRSP